MPIDIDAHGAANIRLDGAGNIECTDEGLAYRGTILPPIVLDPVCSDGCGEASYSVLREDGLGRPWAPAIGCTQRVVSEFSGDEGGTEIAAGFPRHIPLQTQTITLADDLCYSGKVTSYVSGSLGVSMPGARKQINFDMLVNGQPGLGAMEWDYIGTNTGANGHRLTISGRMVEHIIQPGGSAAVTAQLVISNGPQASANIGIFGWNIKISTIILAIQECA